MNICYIDAFSGLAGDMLLAALADAGADPNTISSALQSLALNATTEFDRVQRRGIAALKFRVHATDSQNHRHLTAILKLIHSADLPAAAKSRAEQIFRTLGEAEAAVHGIDIERVHFHEVVASRLHLRHQ